MSDENHIGKKSGEIFYWNSGVNLSNDSGNSDYLRYGSIVYSPANENSTKIVIPRSGIIKNLVATLITSNGNSPTSPGLGSTRKFVVRQNGVDTALAVGITGNNTTGIDLSNNLKVNQFDLISLSHIVEGSPAANNSLGVVSVEFI